MTTEQRQLAADEIRRSVGRVARAWHASDAEIDDVFNNAERLPLPDGQQYYLRALARARTESRIARPLT